MSRSISQELQDFVTLAAATHTGWPLGLPRAVGQVLIDRAMLLCQISVHNATTTVPFMLRWAVRRIAETGALDLAQLLCDLPQDPEDLTKLKAAHGEPMSAAELSYAMKGATDNDRPTHS